MAAGSRAAALVGALLAMLGAAALGGWVLSASWAARTEQAVQQRLTAVMQGLVEPGGGAQVRLQVGPPWALWQGRVARLQVEASRVRLGDVVAHRVTVEAEQLQLDLPSLLESGRLLVRQARRLQAHLVLTEQDVNEYLKAHYEAARWVTVRLRPEGPSLVAEFGTDPRRLLVQADGRLEVAGERAVVLVFERLAIQPASEAPLTFQLAGLANPMELQLGELPVPVVLEQVRTEEGELHILGRYRTP